MADDQQEWRRLLDAVTQEFEVRERELALLHEIDMQILQGERPLDDTYGYVVAELKELLGSQDVALMLRRGRWLDTVHSTTGTDIGQRVPLEESISGIPLKTKDPLVISDLSSSPHLSKYVEIKGRVGPPIRSLICVPIVLNGEGIGVLTAESPEPDAYSRFHTNAVEAIAAQVAIALQRAQVFDRGELFKEIDKLVLRGDVGPAVVQQALERIMDELRRLEAVPLTGAQIMFLRQETNLEVMHSSRENELGLFLPVADSISGRAVQQKKTVIVGDVRQDPQYRAMLGLEIQSEIAVPIMLSDDLVIGVLNVESDEPDAFHGFYQVLIESFADRVRLLLAFTKLRTDLTDALEMRQANEVMVAIGDQTGHVIHEVNNKVGSLKFDLHVLREQLESPEPHSVAGFLEIVNGMIETAESTLKMPAELNKALASEGTPVDINQMVRSTLDKMRVPAHITIHLELAEHVPTVALFSFDIVLQNLIQNAVDAMNKQEAGVLTIRTRLGSHPDLHKGTLVLTLLDTGPGIEADALPRIFDFSFTTKTKPDHEKKGLGFGLWWVRNFIVRSGGEILAQNHDGGAEFSVRIPVDTFPEQIDLVDEQIDLVDEQADVVTE